MPRCTLTAGSWRTGSLHDGPGTWRIAVVASAVHDPLITVSGGVTGDMRRHAAAR
jgi:hypothetical protein